MRNLIFCNRFSQGVIVVISDFLKTALRFGDFFIIEKANDAYKGVKMKIAVVGIIIEKDRSVAEDVNKLLSDYGDHIVCRMGVPDRVNGIFVISVIVKAEMEIISALSGKLGKLKNVKVKTAMTDLPQSVN